MSTTNTTESLDEQIRKAMTCDDIEHIESSDFDACYTAQVEKVKAILEQEVLRGRVSELNNLPTKDSPRYGIANQPYVTKEWLTNRLAELNTLLGGENDG